MARLPYADHAQFAELIQQAGYPREVHPSHAFRTLAHAPAVAAPALRLDAAIRKELDLDPRLRQLVILRVTQRCGSLYAWIQHAAIARAAGVGDAEIAALEREDVPAEILSDRERAAIALADEILDGPRVSDETFARVREQFSPREVVELLLAVGYFRMISGLLTALDVDLDPAWALQALVWLRSGERAADLAA